MEAKTYIRKEIITAVPVKLVNGNVWPEGLPLPEVPNVEEPVKEIGPGVNVCVTQIQDGFMWSDGSDWPIVVPKERFEKMGFRVADNMSFGDALEAVKQGKRIARRGWNGKGMYVFLVHGMDFHTGADLSELDDQDVEVLDCLVMRTATGAFCPGWLASQTDMLADDWYIAE